jgi:hypothetical protein
VFDMGHGAMDTVTLENLRNKGMEKLLYTFDFFNDRSLYIEFMGEIEAEYKVYYPLVVQSKGNAPGQFFEKIEDDIAEGMSIDDDENEELYEYDEYE